MRTMTDREYGVVFVGGGLAAALLLKELRSESLGRVAVIDPVPLSEKPLVHWSYWSHEPTFYDQFAIGAWRRARVASMPPEPIYPFTLRLVRSTDVFAQLEALVDSIDLDWLRAEARSIARRGDDVYEVSTDTGKVHARWVFDSAVGVPPTFPSLDEPRAVLSGTGIRVVADRPVFDAATATLFNPFDERSFAYLLPLGPAEALLESASFGLAVREVEQTALLRHLRARHPGVRFTVTHVERGFIPLGFAPQRTAGPRHILIGAKRGLVKPSAGYGVVRIARESERLAHLWRQRRPLPPSWQATWQWRLLDKGFLELAAHDPRLPLALVDRTMHAVPLVHSLRFIDEELPPRQLAALLPAALPVVLGRHPNRFLRMITVVYTLRART
jgi:lycopene beta-cyclase